MALIKHQRSPFPYAVGEVYLAALPGLREVEIEDVAPTAPAVKIKGEGWIECAAFAEVVKAKLGRVVYSGGLLGNRRKVVRDGLPTPAPGRSRRQVGTGLIPPGAGGSGSSVAVTGRNREAAKPQERC